MSIDRAKALKAAQKYLARGQLDKAIAEFEAVVASDPKDARSALKLGDLYTRKGDNARASATYHEVAQQYAQQGQFLKAVAVFKQILKLEPGQLAALAALAEMYERLELASDALQTYEQVAAVYARAGDEQRALNALHKVTELDPGNVAAWVRYAEALSKAREIDRAVEAFARGADLLKSQGRYDDYVKVTERLLYHRADDHARARELAAMYLDRGDVKSALTRLQACFQLDATNVETLELLARAFLQQDQLHKSISVYKEIARLHGVAGRLAAQAAALRHVLDMDPADDDAAHALAALDEVDLTATEEPGEEVYEDMIVVDEGSGVGRRPSTMPPSVPPDDAVAMEIERLLAECEVFTRYGLKDKVIAQLHRVLALDPDHAVARQKLQVVEGRQVVTEAVQGGRVVAEAGVTTTKVASTAKAVTAEDDGVIFFDDEPELLLEDDGAPALRPSRLPPPLTGGAALPEEVQQALEEADFYEQQGLTDDARDVLEDALEANPDQPALVARLARMEAGDAVDAEAAPARGSLTIVVPTRAPGPLVRPSRAPADVGDALRAFRQEVRSMIPRGDTATHYDLGIAYMEMGLHQEAIEEFRLCLDGNERACAAHTMIGLCHVERGEMEDGIRHFLEALETPDVSDEEQLELWCELANAHDLLGKGKQALEWYEKVDARRPGFRDVRARIERLRTPSSAHEADEFDEMFDNIIVKE